MATYLPHILKINTMKKSLFLFLILLSINLSAQDLKIRVVDENERPLIILQHEGRNYKITDDLMQELDSEQIKSINVLKGNSATHLYGKNAANGVIQISLKDKDNAEQTFAQIKDQLVHTGVFEEFKDVKSDAFLENKLELKITDTLLQSPLLILLKNGKNYQIKRSLMQDLNPEMIKSINVLKDNIATNIYGKGAANGVVLISLKNDELSDATFDKIKNQIEEIRTNPIPKTINTESMPKNEMDDIHSEKELKEAKKLFKKIK